MRKAAILISWLFQPLLMPLYGALLFITMPIYSFRLMSAPLKGYILVCNALFTLVLPVIGIFILYRNNLIGDIRMEKRSDRNLPVLFTLLSYGANFYFLGKVPLPHVYYLFLVSAMVSLFTVWVISFFWKISMHMTGIGGLCGSVLLLNVLFASNLHLYLALMFFIAGCIGSARLILDAHSPLQLALGFTVGFLPQLLVLFVL
ncbi:MAG: hypothetical protein ACK5CY_09630 [Bacteroidia bacterium]|jgi:hypothetical protein